MYHPQKLRQLFNPGTLIICRNIAITPRNDEDKIAVTPKKMTKFNHIQHQQNATLIYHPTNLQQIFNPRTPIMCKKLLSPQENDENKNATTPEY